MLIWQEITFYYSHRWLHTPSMYGRVHKLHHQFTAPIGAAAEYAEPLEFIVSNGNQFNAISYINSVDCFYIRNQCGLVVSFVMTYCVLLSLLFVQLYHCY